MGGFGALLASGLLFSVLLFGGALSGYDWSVNFQYYDWIRTSLTQHGTLPLFMADALHSQDLLANPQSPILGPLIWLLLFVSAQTYIKLLILVYSTCGVLATLYLVRDLGAGLPVGIFCALLFAFNGFMVSHLSIGHHMMLGLYLLPALLLFYRRAVRGRGYAVWAAAIVYVCVIFEGSNHPFIWQNLFLTSYAVFCAIQMRSLRPIWIWALILIAAMGLGAVKLVPMWQEFSDYQVSFNLARLTPLAAFWSMVWRGQSVDTEWPGIEFINGSGWWEWAFYLGALGGALFVVGVLAARRSWPLAATGAVFLMLSIDWPRYLGFLNLWDLVADGPIFNSQRAPSRLFILAILGFLLFASDGLQRLWERSRRLGLLAWPMAVLCLGAVAADLGWEGYSWQKQAVGQAPASRPHVPSLSVFGPGSPTVKLVEFAPDRLAYSVESEDGCTLVYQIPWIWRDRWQIDPRGTGTRPVQGWLAVLVPSGRHELVLRYTAFHLIAGAVLSGISLLVAIGSLALPRRFTDRLLDAAGAVKGDSDTETRR